MDSSAAAGQIPFHERQSKMLCAVHVVNNLCQRHAVGEDDFDRAARAVEKDLKDAKIPQSWFQLKVPMLGNYDAQVLLKVLSDAMPTIEFGFVHVEFDSSGMCDAASLERLWRYGAAPSPRSMFVINEPSPSFLFRSARHWYAVRCLEGAWWNLDSRLKVPDCIGGAEDLKAFFQRTLRIVNGEATVLLSSRDIESPCLE